MLSKEIVSLGLGLELAPSGESLPKPQVGADVAEQVRFLLRGFALHAQAGEPADRLAFQNALNEAADSLGTRSSPEDLRRAVLKALKAVEEYEASCLKGATEETGNLRRMLQAMTETLIFLSGSSETGVRQLTLIEHRLESATNRYATRELKPILDQCLHMLRQECQRIQTQSNERIVALKAEVETLKSCLAVARVADPPDPVTSLPGRLAAERAIQEVARGGRRALAALFVVDQLAAINGTFGRDAGDDLLLGVAQTLAKELSDAPLYRWSGPAILAIFSVKADLRAAEGRAKRITELKTEKKIQNRQGGHQVVSIGCTLRLQVISPDLSPESIFHTFDTFVAGS